MGTHVLLPSGLAIYATLGRAKTGARLGDLFVFRQANPAIVNVLGHGYDGSNYTELEISAWEGAACTTTLASTIGSGGAGGLRLLATTNGTGCEADLVLYVTFGFLWGRAGAFQQVAPGHVRATAPGFADVDIYAAAASVPFAGAPAGPYYALPLAAGDATGLSSGGAAAVAPAPNADGAVNVTVTSSDSVPALFVALTTLAQGRFASNWAVVPAMPWTTRFIGFPETDAGGAPVDIGELSASLRVEHLGQYISA